MVYTYWREKPNEYVNPEQMPEVSEVALREYLKSDQTPFILGQSQYEGDVNSIDSPTPAMTSACLIRFAGGLLDPAKRRGRTCLRLQRLVFPGPLAADHGVPGAQQMRHVKTLFDSLPWWQLVPDYQHQILVQGYGEYTRANYVTVAATDDKSLFVAYLPLPHPVTLDMI